MARCSAVSAMREAYGLLTACDPVGGERDVRRATSAFVTIDPDAERARRCGAQPPARVARGYPRRARGRGGAGGGGPRPHRAPPPPGDPLRGGGGRGGGPPP